jgi:hypothetical protein
VNNGIHFVHIGCLVVRIGVGSLVGFGFDLDGLEFVVFDFVDTHFVENTYFGCQNFQFHRWFRFQNLL